MKSFYFFLCYGIGLLSVFSFLTISAGGSEPNVSIDKTKIRAIIKDAMLDVSVPISYEASQPARYEVSLSIEDLKGMVLGSSSMPIDMSRDTKEIRMVVNANVDCRAASGLHSALYALKRR